MKVAEFEEKHVNVKSWTIVDSFSELHRFLIAYNLLEEDEDHWSNDPMGDFPVLIFFCVDCDDNVAINGYVMCNGKELDEYPPSRDFPHLRIPASIGIEYALFL